MKKCTKCSKEKEFSEFSKNSPTDGHYRRCRECRNKDRPSYKSHGVTTDQFNSLLIQQNNKCPICTKEFDGISVKINIDHDHSCCNKQFSCGECIRGLICSSCNSMLGMCNDDPKIIIAAIDYLEMFNE